ncbi:MULTISPECIES: helix-turn-helix domain-containing protein [unclassified Streptomyces]|uniref:helix-turn-helix domain-containing protein n=1 Tax=unclassified Streptomyces TaxID=2593676 RepID=UPI003711F647
MVLPGLPLGERVRQQRIRLGRTQAVVAGLCGIATDCLSQIERGLRVPSSEVVGRLAAELRVPADWLLGDDDSPRPREQQGVAGDGVVRALLGRHVRPAPVAVEACVLRERVEAAWGVWQTSPTRFTSAEAVLPDLISDVEATVAAHRCGTGAAAERREVLRAAVDLYGLLRSYCRRVDRLDLALMVADRALRAAEDTDDPLRIAAARWNLGHVLHSRPGQEAEAAEVAMSAADELGRTLTTVDAVAVRGALELVAVVAEARTRRPWAARERLTGRVAPLAEQVGEGNTLWTVFGRTNTELHAVSVEMTDGDAVEGLRLADRVDVSKLPSMERRFTFGLEVARCYDLRRDDAAVLVHLLELEELAPEDLERSPLARTVTASLVGRARPTLRRQAVGLAERLHLL